MQTVRYNTTKHKLGDDNKGKTTKHVIYLGLVLSLGTFIATSFKERYGDDGELVTWAVDTSHGFKYSMIYKGYIKLLGIGILDVNPAFKSSAWYSQRLTKNEIRSYRTIVAYQLGKNKARSEIARESLGREPKDESEIDREVRKPRIKRVHVYKRFLSFATSILGIGGRLDRVKRGGKILSQYEISDSVYENLELALLSAINNERLSNIDFNLVHATFRHARNRQLQYVGYEAMSITGCLTLGDFIDKAERMANNSV